ncbi:MAG: YigZ family protein [Butyricicoccus sp.]|nr:YigZ family protein [Butyricicoccus sp.]
MEIEKDYLVPYLDFAEDSFVEKRSKFYGRIWHVETAEEATAKIKECREKYWDATHNCYAYILREGNTMRYSDDGEPGGTAGMPMLEVLRHEGLVDVCCVVTRYFGGILLGTGGLVRAYTEGAKVAVAAAGVQRMSLYSVLLITCGYNQLGTLQQLLPRYDCQIEETDYGADVTLTVTQPAGRLDELNTALAEATAGTVTAEEIETKFMGRREK